MTDVHELIFMCLSIRGSERVATEAGSRLDKITNRDNAFADLHALFKESTFQSTSISLFDALMKHRSTAVFSSQFGRVFSISKAVTPCANVVFDMNVDKTMGVFRPVSMVILSSDAQCLDSVEGDDLIVVVVLKRTNEVPTVNLYKRPSAKNVLQLLRNLGLFVNTSTPELSERFRPGFYIVPTDFTQSEFDSLAEPDTGIALCAGTAYFFYTWLVCQRAERNMLAVSVNGDWDDEFRKLILVKKQVIAARKTALLKNRAFPGSPLLNHLKKCLVVFRLEDQLAYLTEQAEETTKALEMQNAYVTSSRIQSIEAIIFISTIMGLAVAINALQMPPFFDASTTNALERPIFWYVMLVIAIGGVILWGLFSQWRRFRKLLRHILMKFFQS